MSTCPRCGASFPTGAAFCPQCGANATAPPATGGQAPPPQPGGYGPPPGPGSWAPPPGPGTWGPASGAGYGGSWNPVPPTPPPPPGSNKRAIIIALSTGLVLLVLLVVVGVARNNVSRTSSRRTYTYDDPTFDDPSTAGARPRAGLDHWHIAFGIYDCDHFLPALADAGPDLYGIHTHEEGVIHVHPFSQTAAGERATLDVFADQVGLQFAPKSVRLPSGMTIKDGEDCNGQPGRWVLREWDVDDPTSAPRTVASSFGTVPLDGDRRAMTLAFVPEGADVPQPPSVPKLDQLSDAPSTTSTTRHSGTTVRTR